MASGISLSEFATRGNTVAAKDKAHIGLTAAPSSPELMYLDLLKGSLTRTVTGEKYRAINPRRGTLRWAAYAPFRRLLSLGNLEIVRKVRFDRMVRALGQEWPADAETMIGLVGLDNLQYCIADVLRRDVPGDLIETGVWRGGACIFMRAMLRTYGDTSRVVWVADSFQGLPKPDAGAYPADAGDRLWSFPELAVSVDEVKANFERYGLLDDQVQFVVGFFNESLHKAPIGDLAVLRLDGDLYQSTMDALTELHPKVSVGGYVIVDDYNAMESCKQAVHDYRAAHGVTEELIHIPSGGVFWRRERLTADDGVQRPSRSG